MNVHEPGSNRAQCLDSLAHELQERSGDGYLVVAVDGVDGAGKTTFATELVAALGERGVNVDGLSADGFLNERAVRYRQGRDSPRGFCEDSVNVRQLTEDVLLPFTAEGRYSRRGYDLSNDTALPPAWVRLPRPAILIVDGVFLHQATLAGHWGFSIWLDVPFAVSVARMAARDGTEPDSAHPTIRRYVEGQQIYLRECDPAGAASVVIDNSDLGNPSVTRRR